MKYPTEAQEQAAIFRWASMQRCKYPELDLLYHIPNEGKRNATTGANLKRQGLKKGVPDMCLPVARGGKHGLYIELKRRGGRVSPEQAWWIKGLNSVGYSACVCYGAVEAIETICKYLKGSVTGDGT